MKWAAENAATMGASLSTGAPMNTAKYPRLALSACATALALLAVGAQAQETSLSSDEIRAAWMDKTVFGTLVGGPLGGRSIELQLKSDGTASVSGAVTDIGTWRLPGQGYCATWAKIRAGQERCFTVVRKGTDTLMVNPDGSVSTLISAVR
jgi:hypothetical protein